ncbi:MAG TPA: hypothetical protein VME17_12225 [Bryobacteraceae bacterium]|nr:hypothetical protein [Bryobacteraceae bacterium]
MPLVIFEKMVLIEGITVGGRNPATTITMAAASKEYSMKSCPRWSFQIANSQERSNNWHMVFSASISILRQSGATYN